HSAFEPSRNAKRAAVPAEGEDLLEPGELGDSRIGPDTRLERMPCERSHQAVAGSAAGCSIVASRKAEARDLNDVRPGRRRGGAKAGEQPGQDMGAGRQKQPGRAEMVAMLVGDDQISCMLIVELVELEPVDEHALAVLEHGPERPIGAGLARSAFNDDRHSLASPLEEQASREASGGDIPRNGGCAARLFIFHMSWAGAEHAEVAKAKGEAEGGGGRASPGSSVRRL